METPKRPTGTVSFTLTPDGSACMAVPGQPDVKRWLFYLPGDTMPAGIPLEPNARRPRLSTKTYKAIEARMLGKVGDPAIDHLRGHGMKIIAEAVIPGPDGTFEMVCRPDVHGVVDGGHTYELCKRHHGEGLLGPIPVEVLTGLSDEAIPEISEGLNSSTQVPEASVMNLRGEFDWIQDALAGHPAAGMIEYCQNGNAELGAARIKVEWILQMLAAVNPLLEERAGFDPAKAYVSKHAVIQAYQQHKEMFAAFAPILVEVLEFSEQLSVVGASAYNGRGRRFGGLRSTTEVKLPLPFTGATARYVWHKGVLLPLMAAFRDEVTVDRSGQYRWRNSYDRAVSLWADVAPEVTTWLARNAKDVAAFGRSSVNWQMLHSKVVMGRLNLAA